MILRPPEKVFAFVSNLDNWAQPSSENGASYHAPVRVGDTFRQIFELQGQRVELLCKVTGYEKDALLSFEYAWDSSLLGIDFIFKPASDGTRLTGKGEGLTNGLLKLFEPLVDREVNKEIEANLNTIKYLLESEVPGDR
jgi:hypothetical protein